MSTLKISLAIFFLRIMIKPWQRKAVYLAVGISTLFNIGYFFFVIFQCGYPSSAMLFLERKMSDRCISRAPILGLSYTHGAVTSLTDVTFALLPLAMLHSLRMNMRERITVGLILVLAAAYVVRLLLVMGTLTGL